MIIYTCEKCGTFLGEIKNKNNMRFKAKKGIEVQNDKIILKCKCGKVKEIDIDEDIKKGG